MELRTVLKTEPSAIKISYDDPVAFLGSCFANNIGSRMSLGRMPVMINPAGPVYNPASVSDTLDIIIKKKEFTKDDLYCYQGLYLSFFHYTEFSSPDWHMVLDSINNKAREAGEFMSSAKFLFITFGTARVFRLKESGNIVSNCHKLPASFFERDLLTVKEIVDLWRNMLDRIRLHYPDLKVVFTVSPVRHWKDGAHGNQLSKSVLFVAIEELLSHPAVYGYFPAYEIVMDDLRDYRFYDDDMLHPSSSAIDYIWEAFSNCYFDGKTTELFNEVSGITRALSHRIRTGSEEQTKKFAENIINRINSVKSRIPGIDLNGEEAYFRNLLNNIKEC